MCADLFGLTLFLTKGSCTNWLAEIYPALRLECLRKIPYLLGISALGDGVSTVQVEIKKGIENAYGICVISISTSSVKYLLKRMSEQNQSPEYE